jgi:hypothetical protein
MDGIEAQKLQRDFVFRSTIPHASVDPGFLVALEAVSVN